MAVTDHSRFVIAYHGCDEEVARKVLQGGTDLSPSRNDYDWLGAGIYFWEQGPRRAYEFALEESKRAATKIKNPAVVGAYIYLGTCLDLLDTAEAQFAPAHERKAAGRWHEAFSSPRLRSHRVHHLPFRNDRRHPFSNCSGRVLGGVPRLRRGRDSYEVPYPDCGARQGVHPGLFPAQKHCSWSVVMR